MQQALRRSTYANFRDKLYVCLGPRTNYKSPELSWTVGAYELKVDEGNPSVPPSVCNPATLIAYLVLCRLTLDFVYDVHACTIGLDAVRE